MAQRYVPGDGHFSRDRSPPPRSGDRYAPGQPSGRPPFPPADGDRGPARGTWDGPSRGAGSFAPRGSRGGFPGRGDYPSYRDREPLIRDRRPSPPPRGADDRDRSWRNDRGWSPPRSRDFPPRDSDFDRRRDSSASAPYGDSMRGASAPRGRGRGDWSFRGGRGRPSFREERDRIGGDSFRPGDRSPVRDRPSWVSRDDRAFSARSDDRFPDRRDDERDRPGKEAPPPIDTSRRPSVAGQPSSTSYAPASASRAMAGSEKDFLPQRRLSSYNPPPPNRDLWREETRSQAGSDHQGSRPASPPRPPEIPAFGSVVPSKPAPAANKQSWPPRQPTSSPKVTKQPLPTSAQSATSSVTDSGATKAAPDDSSKPPPTGPRADRDHSQVSPSIPPTGSLKSPPTGPRQPPTGPRAQRQQSQGFLARSAKDPSTSPNLVPQPGLRPIPAMSSQAAPKQPAIPTGPRADRPIPTQPYGRQAADTAAGPASWQWNRSASTIPTKRDANGESMPPRRSFSGPRSGSLRDDVMEDAPSEPRGNRDGRESIKDEADPKRFKPEHFDDLHEEDDLMDLDEGDFADNEEKFEREKAVLEARKVDLSANYLSAVSPLRRLALAQRLSLFDSTVLFNSRTVQAQQALEDAQQDQDDLLTPKASEESEDAKEPLRRPLRRKTPPPKSPPPITAEEIASLPFLNARPLTPVSDLDLTRNDVSKALVLEEIRKRQQAEDNLQEKLKEEYIQLYKPWRERCAKLDEELEDEERRVAAQSLEPAPPAATEASPTFATSNEGTRGSRRGQSEYDMQLALERSVASAAQEALKREKEASSAQPDYSREAVIPDMLPDTEVVTREFLDTTQLRNASQALVFYQLLPPEDDFTEDEHQALVQNFKEYPKKFGKLAQALPGRTYKDCINHYYATKWNKEFKPPKDKRKVRRTKVGGRAAGSRPRASALISNLGGDAQPDLYGGDEAGGSMVVPMNDNGRPRRAAAPTFGADPGDSSGAPTPGRKGVRPGMTGEAGSEKPVRKPKSGAVKEKQSRRPKGQGAAQRQSSMSPEKMDVDVEAGKSMNVMPGRISGSMGPADPLAQDVFVGGNASGLPQPTRGGQTTSYWSVLEVSSFPQYLRHFGTDWQAISNHMGTKTATMVKNYYGRMLQNENRQSYEQAAQEADDRRKRGEETAPPPTPSMPNRRRPDTALTSTPRPLAPSTEPVDVSEGSPQPAKRHNTWTIPSSIPKPTSSISMGNTGPSRTTSLEHPPPNIPPYGYATQPKPPVDILANDPFRRQETRPESVHSAYPPQPNRIRNPEYAAYDRPAQPISQPPEPRWQPNQLPEPLPHDRGTAPGSLMHRGYYSGSPPRQEVPPPAAARGAYDVPRFEPHSRYERPEDLRQAPAQPQRSSFFDPLRAAGPPREEHRPVVPPPAAPARTEPRRSNISALLNADPEPPKPAEPRTYTPSHSSPFAPPARPSSQPDVYREPHRSSSGQYGPPPVSRHPHEQQPHYAPAEPQRASTTRPEIGYRYGAESPHSMRPYDRPPEQYDHRAAMTAPSPPPVPRFASTRPPHSREPSYAQPQYQSQYHQSVYGAPPPERNLSPYQQPPYRSGPPPPSTAAPPMNHNAGLPSFLQARREPSSGRATPDRLMRDDRGYSHPHGPPPPPQQSDRREHEQEMERPDIGLGLSYRRASDYGGAFRRE